jgi:hypothetical protein
VARVRQDARNAAIEAPTVSKEACTTAAHMVAERVVVELVQREAMTLVRTGSSTGCACLPMPCAAVARAKACHLPPFGGVGDVWRRPALFQLYSNWRRTQGLDFEIVSSMGQMRH